MLGVPPAAGRLIGGEDDREGAPPVAVISYGFAQRRFGSAAAAIGERATVNDAPFLIVGVAPPEFYGVNPGQAQEICLPQRASILMDRIYSGDPRAKYADAKFYWRQIIGRLKPGVKIAQAQAALEPVFHQFVTSVAANDKERADLPKLLVAEASGGIDDLRRQYSKPLYFSYDARRFDSNDPLREPREPAVGPNRRPASPVRLNEPGLTNAAALHDPHCSCHERKCDAFTGSRGAIWATFSRVSEAA